MKSFVFKVNENSYNFVSSLLGKELHKCEDKECFVKMHEIEKTSGVKVEFIGKDLKINGQFIDFECKFDISSICKNITSFSIVKVAKKLYILGRSTNCSCQRENIGIDLNSDVFITTSKNIKFDLLKTRKYINKLHEKKRKLRTCDNDEMRKKILYHIRKTKFKIEQNLNQELNEIVNELLFSYDVIFIEDLGLVQKNKFNYKINNYVYSLFRSILVSKSHLFEKDVVCIDNNFASTRICSFCGKLNQIFIYDDIYECKNCAIKIDRDYNAARNILNRGEKLYEK